MRDRDLVRLYWPSDLRPAFDALFDVDDAMANVVAKATEPALAAIKLAWWRDRLHELDEGKVPAEPRLQAAAKELLPRGVSGGQLAGLEDGWAAILDQQPDEDRVAKRGARLFRIASRLLGSADPVIEVAGRLYAIADAWQRGMTISTGPWLQDGHSFPRIASGLRPLTMLAALALRDLQPGDAKEPQATPGRAWTLLRHRLTGRIA